LALSLHNSYWSSGLRN